MELRDVTDAGAFMTLDNDFFRSLLDVMDQSCCLIDRRGSLIYCNSSFQNRYLDSNSRWNGLPWNDVCNSEHRRISLLEKALVSGAKETALQDNSEGNPLFVTVEPLKGPAGERLFLETISWYPGRDVLFPTENKSEFVTPHPIFEDTAMKQILETVHRISNFDSTILITGESGTGKSMLARYIHQNSRRAGGPFITIDCATIPDNLIESELFGYVSGAFTGASQKGKAGMVEQADKGTLFLDEIGLLPLPLQSKFLQLIQERSYTPIGALKSKTVDTRIISATNMDLKVQVQENRFREDLYYRLRVIEFSMPPLRDRQDAIEPLIDHFLQQFNRKYGIQKDITGKAKDLLRQYTWKGNVRELQYVMERAIATSPSSQITAEDIPPLSDESNQRAGIGGMDPVQFEIEMDRFEYRLLRSAFETYKSSYKVAEALGLTQSKASRLLRKHNIRI